MAPSLKFSVIGLTSVFMVGFLISVLKNKSAFADKNPVTRLKEPVAIPYKNKSHYADTPLVKTKVVLKKEIML